MTTSAPASRWASPVKSRTKSIPDRRVAAKPRWLHCRGTRILSEQRRAAHLRRKVRLVAAMRCTGQIGVCTKCTLWAADRVVLVPDWPALRTFSEGVRCLRGRECSSSLASASSSCCCFRVVGKRAPHRYVEIARGPFHRFAEARGRCRPGQACRCVLTLWPVRGRGPPLRRLGTAWTSWELAESGIR
jgi:hypothetical protein